MTPLHWGAINPHTGRPYTWDDPNLRWGDPAYALDPGDPGYVPYALPTPPKPRKPTMKHNVWYPIRTADQIGWLQNYTAKLGSYATALGLSPADTAATTADARWLIYVLGTWLPAGRAWQQSCTQAAEAAQFGTGGTLVLPVFTAPPLPGATGALPAVVPMPEGSLERIFATIAGVRPVVTSAIAEDLRLVGPEKTGPDFATFGPRLTAEATATGVKIGWGWQGQRDFLDQCEIEVDRADAKGWGLLTIDTTPGYLDATPLPATLTRWKYRAIYRVDDQRVGQWSPEVSAAVGG